jgi:hypothetical protein
MAEWYTAGRSCIAGGGNDGNGQQPTSRVQSLIRVGRRKGRGAVEADMYKAKRPEEKAVKRDS